MNSTFKKIILHGFILSVIDTLIVLISLFITNRGFYIFSYEPLAVILSFILVLGINLLIYSFSNLIISVFITFNFFSFLSVTSLIKYELRNIPVVFNDLFIINEVNRINGYVNISDYTKLIFFTITIEILLIALYLWSRKKIDLKAIFSMRIFGLFLSIALISSSYFLIETTQISFEKSGPIYIFTSSIKNTSKYTLNNTEEELLMTLLEEKISHHYSESDLNPNIIIIMNEAFWDIDQLPNITIEPNPYEYFDSLKTESIHGRLEVPVFAGGTINTEFEILTSISTHMYEQGLMVFNNEIQKPIITLASILRHQGYKSVGLHPFWGWYYDRNLIYSHLGFDQFISDEYINNSTIKGYYISDDTTTDVIIKQIEETKEPLFLYAVTMQNHGPYNDGRYDNIELDVQVTGNSLDQEDQLVLDTYAQGIYDAVASLEKLINYLETSEEETIVLFFGDHLPLLGNNYKIYLNTSFIEENENYIEKYIKMKTTPFILWSNKDKIEKNIGILDASFIGPYILDLYKLKMPNYYNYQLKQSVSVPFVNPIFLKYNDNYYYSDTQEYIDISNPMIAIQKDIMYGDSLYEGTPEDWLISNNFEYNQDARTIFINSVYEDENYLIIVGENLYSKGKLFINSKEIPFEYNANELRVKKEFIPTDSSLIIKLILIDTIEKSLARSNEFIYNR